MPSKARDLSLTSHISEPEQGAIDDLKRTIFTHILQKHSLAPEQLKLGLQEHIAAVSGHEINAEPATVVYLSIVDQHADTLSAMEEVTTMLHRQYLRKSNSKYLVLVGDQKVFARLNELKYMYGSELEWLIPFIGDWHTLHNYQKVLMKVYYGAGLKELAAASGHRGETLTSISQARHFAHTHALIMQAWEAIYRHMLDLYLAQCESEGTVDHENMLESLKHTSECDVHC